MEEEVTILYFRSWNLLYGETHEISQLELLKHIVKPNYEYIVSVGGLSDPWGPFAIKETH